MGYLLNAGVAKRGERTKEAGITTAISAKMAPDNVGLYSIGACYAPACIWILRYFG